jgi:TRAP-type C4-dicarboxylate transport system permease small subunit
VVSQEERHLKVRALDVVEYVLLCLSGLLLLTFTITVFLDVLTRTLGAPLLWLQEATLAAFIWGLFLGAAVALRRNEHIYVATIGKSMSGLARTVLETFNALVLLAISLVVAYYGFSNFRQAFGNILPVTGMPLAYIMAAIPVFGLCTAAFTVERLVKGWQNGFEGVTHDPREQVLRATEQTEGGS